MAAGYALVKLEPGVFETNDLLKRQLTARMLEIYPGGATCPGGRAYGTPNEAFYPKGDDMRPDVTIEQYIVTDPDAGVIGYCSVEITDDIYYHLVRPADDRSRYDYTAKVVYVDISCSFTLSKDNTGTMGGETVERIIGRKRSTGKLPNVGKFIKEMLGYALCSSEKVDATIFISTPMDDKAAAQHLKNGSVLLNPGGDGLFDNLVTEQGLDIFERMNDNGFFDQIVRTRTAADVYGMFGGKLFLRYPPLMGGGRRRRRRGQKSKKRRQCSYSRRRRRLRGTRR
jgi:hypothetical protein